MSNYTQKAELHCHTTSNDLFGIPFMYESVMSPSDLLNEALKQNIRVIAITDHDHMRGSYEAQKIIQEKNLPIILIPASEVTTRDGHILAYGITKEIPEKLPLKEALEAIHSQKGLAIAAHPFTGVFGIHEAVFTNKIDGVEGYNAMTFKQKENDEAKEAATRLNIPAIAGSDAHQSGAMGKATVWFRESVTTAEDVLQAIRDKDFITKESHPNLLRLTCDQAWGHVKIYSRMVLGS